MTNRMVDGLLVRLQTKNMPLPNDPHPREALRALCVPESHALSVALEAQVEVGPDLLSEGTLPFTFTFARVEVERLFGELLTKTKSLVRAALDGANVTVFEVSDIVLFGGTTRTPFLRSAIQAMLPNSTMQTEMDAEYAVMLGASECMYEYHRAMLQQAAAAKRKAPFVDVLPIGLGVGAEPDDGVVHPVLLRTSAVGAIGSCVLPTTTDWQAHMLLHVYEGNSSQTFQCVKVAAMNVVLTVWGEKHCLKVKLAMSVTETGEVKVQAEEEDPSTCNESPAKYECVISNPVDTACGVQVAEMVAQTKSEDVKQQVAAVGRKHLRGILVAVQALVTTRAPAVAQSDKFLATMGRAEQWLQQHEHIFFHDDMDEWSLETGIILASQSVL